MDGRHFRQVTNEICGSACTTGLFYNGTIMQRSACHSSHTHCALCHHYFLMHFDSAFRVLHSARCRIRYLPALTYLKKLSDRGFGTMKTRTGVSKDPERSLSVTLAVGFGAGSPGPMAWAWPCEVYWICIIVMYLWCAWIGFTPTVRKEREGDYCK